jgi:hypothetical protein
MSHDALFREMAAASKDYLASLDTNALGRRVVDIIAFGVIHLDSNRDVQPCYHE